jgi:carboxymethylenebutenolidase
MATSNDVELKSKDGGTFSAYLAVPDKPNGGAVVVLQEIFGINANIRRVADSLANDGYIAIAPDLFWRQEPDVQLDPSNEADRQRATVLLKGLDQPLAVEDALVAADHVRQLRGTTGKVGTVGYCLGGKLAYLMAMRPGINAAVSYYGVAIQAALDQIGNVQGKLLLHIAEQDHLCPAEAQADIAAAAAPHADRISIMTYPGVGHAFARQGGATFNAASAERADKATLALLRAQLSEKK